MNEHYLHLIWQLKRLPLHRLSTVDGQSVSILHTGSYNRDSGPDFFNGRLEMNGVIHAGNIEMHVRSSDWYLHGHQHDRAYDNVILHVVYEYDKPVRMGDEEIPTVELKHLIDREHFAQSQRLICSGASVPCAPMLDSVPGIHIRDQLQSSLTGRMMRRAQGWSHQLSGRSPQESLFVLFAAAFGMKTNMLPFVELAHRLPLRALLRTSAADSEAIVFGVSGLLDDPPASGYALELAKTWDFHRSRLSLHAQNPAGWKRKGCRPGGFPAVRLAQFAAFIHRMNWSQDFWEQPAREILMRIRQLLCLPMSEYWQQHYDFGKMHKRPVRGMSAASADLLIINAVVPFLNLLAVNSSQPAYTEKALELLEMMPAEKNAVIDRWKMLGISARNAGESQGLLELKNEFCDRKKCLHCKTGMFLLGR